MGLKPFLLRSATIPIIFLVSILFASCAVSDTVVAHYNSDQPAKAKRLSHVGKTHWSFFWGLLKQGDWAAGCQPGSNMSQVRVKTNAGFLLVSVISLGIAVPQKLEWDCAPPTRGTGIIGN